MLQIGIVTADPETDPSIRVFKALEKEYNCTILTIDPLSTQLPVDLSSVDIFYPRISGKGKSLVERKFDFYIKAVQSTNKPYIGNLEKIKLLKNKCVQVSEAIKAGLRVPKTVLLDRQKDLESQLSGFNFPVVMKACYSFGGRDVMLASSKEEIAEQLNANNENYIIQELIKLDRAVDYRVYVIGNQVHGGITRENDSPNEFRANTALGGSATFFEPGPELASLAVQYAASSGSEIIAVDFIKKDGSYYFIEANDAFSVKTDNEPKKEAVARAILSYCLTKCSAESNYKEMNV